MTAPSPRPRSRRLWPIALAVAVIPFVLFSLYLGLMLSWSYSDGERAGVLQKFSRKGWFCKTYEGELAMYIVGGVAPQIWDFSVRDVAAVEQLHKAVGREVRLHYSEHRGLPTNCFGETDHFVEKVEIVGDLEPIRPMPGVQPAPPAAPPAAPPSN